MTDSIDANSVPDSELPDSPDLNSQEETEAADSEPLDPDETLLDQLDRRQNSVLEELDELDARIQALVSLCQNRRSEAA